MKTKLLIAAVVGLILSNLTMHIGCQTVDPVTGQPKVDLNKLADNIDLVIDAAEAYAVFFYTGKDYDNFIVRAEQMRRINDLPAARRLLATLSGRVATPATQPK